MARSGSGLGSRSGGRHIVISTRVEKSPGRMGLVAGAPNGAVGFGFGIVGACGAGLSVSVPASVPADNESNGMLFPITPSSAPAPDGAARIWIEIEER